MEKYKFLASANQIETTDSTAEGNHIIAESVESRSAYENIACLEGYLMDEFDEKGDNLEKSLEIVRGLWGNQEIKFAQKFNLLKKFIGIIVSDENEGDHLAVVSDRALKYILKIEDNFFLHSIIVDFYNDREGIRYSNEERRGIIASSWDKNHVTNDGETYFYDAYISIPRTIRSVDDLTDDEVVKITEEFIDTDIAFMGVHRLRELDIASKLEDAELQKEVVTKTQLELFNIDTKDYHEYSYADLDAELHSIFVSRVSKDIGVIYKEGGEKEFFRLEDVRKSSAAEEFSIDNAEELVGFFNVLKNAKTGDREGVLENVKKWPAFIGIDDEEEISRCFSAEELSKYSDKLYTESKMGVVIDPVLNQIPPYTQSGVMFSDNEVFPFKAPFKGIFDRVFLSTCAKIKNALSLKEVVVTPLDKIIHDNTLLLNREDQVSFDQLYGSFSAVRMRLFMEDYFGFSYAEIPIAVQLQFLNYVWDKNVDTIEKVRDFVQKGITGSDKIDRFTSFLSLEYGNDFGNDIMTLGERLPKAEAQTLFRKYAEIVDASNNVSAYLKEHFGEDKKYSPEIVQEIQENMLRRGRTLLMDFAEYVKQQASGSILSGEEINQKLSIEVTSVALLDESFRAYKKENPTASIEDLVGVNFDILDNKDARIGLFKDQMKAIYRENWEHVSDELIEAKIKGLEDKLSKEGHMYLATHTDGKEINLLAFASVVKTENGSLFGSALNKNPKIKAGDIGRTILEKIIAQEAQSDVLNANVEYGTATQRAYLNSYNFLGTGVHNESGVAFLDITLDTVLRARLVTASWNSVKDVMQKEEEGSLPEGVKVLRLANVSDTQDLFANGYILVKNFSNGVFVFEKPFMQAE